MSSILKKLLALLAPRSREYLIIDQNLNILEASLGARRFADSPQEVIQGKDIRIGFPELIGLEETLLDILQGKQDNFELKSLGRFSPKGNCLYFNLSIIKNQYEKSLQDKLIIFLEDVTEQMVLEQTLVQASNQNSLLLSELTNSKAYIDQIITSMADALLVTTQSGTIKTANPAAKALFGYPGEELIGKSISTIITDEEFLTNSNNASRLAQDSYKNIEVVCRTKKGQKVTVSFSCSTTQTDFEDLKNFIYIGRDITEHQRNQKRLAVQHTTTLIMSESATLSEASPKILRAVCESLEWDIGELWTPTQDFGGFLSSDRCSSTVLRCVETWVNPSVNVPDVIKSNTETTFVLCDDGLSHHILASRLGSWMPTVMNDASVLHQKLVADTGLLGAFGFPIISNGEVLGVMIFFSWEIPPADEYLVKVLEGISSQFGQFIKRKQAEAALLESEERYRDLFENASDLIQCVKPDGRFVYVNRAWQNTLGYSEAELAKMTVFDVVHPNCQPHCVEVFQRLIAGEKISQMETEFITKDGRIVSLEGNISCKFVEGKPVFTRAIFRNITQRLLTEAALRRQREQTEHLLSNILPSPIVERLRQQPGTIAEDFADVTVMFADIVGFTELSAATSPTELVGLLNAIFSEFDQLAEIHGLEKIKTIGDAYMVVGGVPLPQLNHAASIAEMALDMQNAIAYFHEATGKVVRLRIGINTGPVVAGVIGIKKFSYDLWGDAVNIASRMESHGLEGQIQVTASTYERLKDQYLFEERGVIPVKGKGEMMTYLLVGRK